MGSVATAVMPAKRVDREAPDRAGDGDREGCEGSPRSHSYPATVPGSLANANIVAGSSQM